MEYFLGDCKVCGQAKIVNEEAFCQGCCPAHLKADKAPVAEVPCSAGLEGQPDYAYKAIEEFEKIVGQKAMNDSFRMGWDMARITISELRKLAEEGKAD